jgi:hypothetical protein
VSQSDFLDWWSEDVGDRRVQRRLESELQDAYNYQARQSSALAAQMARVQGSLEQRLEKLTKAFYAFVELSDVRAELAVFEDEATVRHAALRLLRALLQRAADPGAPAVPGWPADLPACRGYWLRPAAASVALSLGAGSLDSGSLGSASLGGASLGGGALAGDAPAAVAALTEARELDPVRPAVFRAAALALAGQPALASPLLPEALGQPGEQVTYAQRALWRACAHGVYGAPGTGLVREWLAGYVRGLDAAAGGAAGNEWASRASETFQVTSLPGQLRHELPRGLSEKDELTSPLVAARELGALAAWVREAVTGEAVTGTPVPPRPGASGAAAGSTDPVTALGAVAAALTEEGSPDEIALTRRARELREIIDDQKASARPSWDALEDATAALLRADAFGPDLPLRKAALDAGAGWITTLADGLAKAATAVPPDQLDISLDGHDVRVSASGQASLKSAYAEIEQENAPQNVSGKLFGRKRAAEEISWEQTHLANAASQAAAAFAARLTELRAAAQQATADHETITAALSPGTPSG